ncbi:DUF4303 domain-containing protein [Shewanella decolorationis]|uniref:DUF4303 domain-containing protein n=1 Tax=Shewanella decolorationis S12 TaxID=1353536 RepID=A0ABN0PLL5_9GAMM|nr:DUF4303 domain-containing protein [Shewanella decolorationis]ESE40909.1 hypothetical protein SHD_2466 [Shewanella decolorationis S12]GLR30816.1 hypothetical protein GCM10007922_03730 [Shewanella decolorationis]
MLLDHQLVARIKAEIMQFITVEVERFLLSHPDKTFYAFDFDTNAEYAELNLCFNTELDFQRCLTYYQSGKWATSYQNPEAIQELKFNTGDWEYQCVSTLYVLSDDELQAIQQRLPEDDFSEWEAIVGQIRSVFSECLQLFTQTEVYQAIPKTDDIIAFSIDHDEDVADMLADRVECAE